MKKVFEIECPNDSSEVWLDASTIHLALHNALGNHPHFTNALVVDISEEISKLRRVVAALFDESDTRIPKGFDQKLDEYAMRVSAHNQALAELARALNEIGYRE